MKIIYVAKHDSGHNDDEGAITHALRRLGHEVNVLREARGHLSYKLEGDFLLFHKWDRVEYLQSLEGKMPRVFWYFDLVDWPSDPTLSHRCAARRQWMQQTLPNVELGFCTDGDWVESCPYPGREKLRWLTQGFDERYDPSHGDETIDVLFVGNERGGIQREEWCSKLREYYGDRFVQVRHGVHGDALANLIASAKVVVCPPSPVTDRYWSNRVYWMAGMGAFLFHPYSEGLRAQYGSSIEWYDSPRQMYKLIDWALGLRPEARRGGASLATELTRTKHLYRHRCEQLVQTVKDTFNL